MHLCIAPIKPSTTDLKTTATSRGFQQESANRHAIRERLERDLRAAQYANQQLQATAEDHTAAIAKAREGYFPVTELESEKTSLATVEGQIASLTKQLEAAKKEMTSLEERAKSMIVEAKGGQKVSDALVAGLQISCRRWRISSQSAAVRFLVRFVKGSRRCRHTTPCGV